MKKHTLKFAKINKKTWKNIKSGKKIVETRAGTEKYRKVSVGDLLILSCDGKKFEKTVKKIQHFRSIHSMLKKIRISEIEPEVKTENELTKIYESYPDYKKKIKKFGLFAFMLE
jgi:ASC-1-like (ASCH) protein